MKRRMWVFALGILSVALVAEIALRLVGMAHYRDATATKRKQGGSDYTILCMGDSFTFGIGATTGRAYPMQLEDLLNARTDSRRFTVVNRGIGGHNTSQIRHDAQGWLAEFQPDLVVLLAGGPNLWNFWGYASYQSKQGILAWMNDRLYRIRLFKLIKLLFRGLAEDKGRPGGGQGKASGHPQATHTETDRGSQQSTGVSASKAGHTDAQQGYLPLAIDAREVGDYDKAFEYFKKAIVENPRNTFLYADLALTMLRINETNQGLAWLIEQAASSPNNVHVLKGVGYAFREIGDNEQAISYFKKGMLTAPRDAGLYADIGMTYLRNNILDKALVWFRKGIAVDASHSASYFGVGSVNSLLGNYPAALASFEKGVELNRNHSHNYTGMGNTFRTMGKNEEAVKWYIRAMRIDPHDLANYEGIADIYTLSGGPVSEEFIELLAAAPDDVPGIKAYRKMFATKKDVKQEILAWIKFDLAAIIALCTERKIPVIVQTYPREMGPLLPSRQFVEKKGALFVDHVKAFERLHKNGEWIEDYFVPDGHCNDAGYALMAQNILDVILEAGIFGLVKSR